MTGFLGFLKKRRMTKRRRIRENAEQGKEAEEKIVREYEMAGYKMERTGIGHDYRGSKRDWLTGKKKSKYIEVKSGDAKLSPLQEKAKKRFGSRYKVERVDPDPYKIDMGGVDFFETEKPKRRRKSEDVFGMDFFGSSDSGKKRKRKKSDDDPFGLGNIDF